MVKYWCKIKNSENILINQLYNESVRLCNKGCKNWAYNVKQMLIEYGFLYVSDENFEGYQTLPFFFKQRVIDVHVYIQEWHGCLERNQVLLSYKYCKTYFNYERYLFKHCRTVFGVIFLDYECLFCL